MSLKQVLRLRSRNHKQRKRSVPLIVMVTLVLIAATTTAIRWQPADAAPPEAFAASAAVQANSAEIGEPRIVTPGEASGRIVGTGGANNTLHLQSASAARIHATVNFTYQQGETSIPVVKETHPIVLESFETRPFTFPQVDGVQTNGVTVVATGLITGVIARQDGKAALPIVYARTSSGSFDPTTNSFVDSSFVEARGSRGRSLFVPYGSSSLTTVASIRNVSDETALVHCHSVQTSNTSSAYRIDPGATVQIEQEPSFAGKGMLCVSLQGQSISGTVTFKGDSNLTYPAVTVTGDNASAVADNLRVAVAAVSRATDKVAESQQRMGLHLDSFSGMLTLEQRVAFIAAYENEYAYDSSTGKEVYLQLRHSYEQLLKEAERTPHELIISNNTVQANYIRALGELLQTPEAEYAAPSFRFYTAAIPGVMEWIDFNMGLGWAGSHFTAVATVAASNIAPQSNPNDTIRAVLVETIRMFGAKAPAQYTDPGQNAVQAIGGFHPDLNLVAQAQIVNGDVASITNDMWLAPSVEDTTSALWQLAERIGDYDAGNVSRINNFWVWLGLVVVGWAAAVHTFQNLPGAVAGALSSESGPIATGFRLLSVAADGAGASLMLVNSLAVVSRVSGHVMHRLSFNRFAAWTTPRWIDLLSANASNLAKRAGGVLAISTSALTFAADVIDVDALGDTAVAEDTILVLSSLVHVIGVILIVSGLGVIGVTVAVVAYILREIMVAIAPLVRQQNALRDEVAVIVPRVIDSTNDKLCAFLSTDYMERTYSEGDRRGHAVTVLNGTQVEPKTWWSLEGPRASFTPEQIVRLGAATCEGSGDPVDNNRVSRLTRDRQVALGLLFLANYRLQDVTTGPQKQNIEEDVVQTIERLGQDAGLGLSFLGHSVRSLGAEEGTPQTGAIWNDMCRKFATEAQEVFTALTGETCPRPVGLIFIPSAFSDPITTVSAADTNGTVKVTLHKQQGADAVPLKSMTVRHRLASQSSYETKQVDASGISEWGPDGDKADVIVGPFPDEQSRCYQTEGVDNNGAVIAPSGWTCAEPKVGSNTVIIYDASPSNSHIEAHEWNGTRSQGARQKKTTAFSNGGPITFDAVDWNGDGTLDRVGFRKRGNNGQGVLSTEVHVQDGRSSSFLLHSTTSLHQTDENFSLHMGDWNNNGSPDMIAIKRNGASSTEIHVIDSNDMNAFVLQTGTILGRTTNDWDFDIADWNGDGQLDVVGIRRLGEQSTEIHVIDGADPSRFLTQQPTVLHRTSADKWDFEVADWNGDGHPDLIGFKRSGQVSAEIHVVDGLDPTRFLLQTRTSLPVVDKNWSLVVAD